MDFLFGNGASWFTVPAVAGTLFLLAQMVLGQLGGDMDTDVDVDSGLDGAGHEFRVLSLQTISAFAMGSGWMGLASMRALNLDFGWAVVIAVLSGVGVAWMLVWLLRSVMKLEESGNISLKETVGERGTVYVQIPPAGQGSGRVTVTVRARRREFNALQRGEAFIASHTGVRVIDVDASANALVVEPA